VLPLVGQSEYSPFRVAYPWPLCANMTLTIKPEVRNCMLRTCGTKAHPHTLLLDMLQNLQKGTSGEVVCGFLHSPVFPKERNTKVINSLRKHGHKLSQIESTLFKNSFVNYVFIFLYSVFYVFHSLRLCCVCFLISNSLYLPCIGHVDLFVRNRCNVCVWPTLILI